MTGRAWMLGREGDGRMCGWGLGFGVGGGMSRRRCEIWAFRGLIGLVSWLLVCSGGREDAGFADRAVGVDRVFVWLLRLLDAEGRGDGVGGRGCC